MHRLSLLLVLGLIACGSSKEQAPAKAAPAAATETASAPNEKPATTAEPATAADPDPGTTEGAPTQVTGAAPAAGTIEHLCQRSEACGCPEPNCIDTFTKLALPGAIVACFAAQPCESLCDPNAGDPASPLLTACPNSLAGGGSATGTACTRTSDCPASHDCCSGFCYQQGSSMWQTVCMRPSGKF